MATAHGEPAAVLARLTSTNDADLKPGHVRIRTEAIGLNWADVLTCRGTYQVRCEPPFTPGLEAAGTVTHAAEGVDPKVVGTRVVALATPPAGAFASSFDVPVDAAIATSTPAVVAAAMFVNFHTAHVALTHRCRLAAGQQVLVHAAAGGTGGAAVQVARALGATVIATCRGADKVAIARQNGAHHVIDLLETEGEFRSQVLELTHGTGVDVVFDPVGGPGFEQSRRCVAWEGTIVVIGSAGGPPASPPLGHVLVKNYSIAGVHWSAYPSRNPTLVANTQRVLDQWLRSGKITPHISAVRRFADVPAALDELANGRTAGKVVIEL